MSAAFPLLSSPLEVGGVRLRNRIVMLPMGQRFAGDGGPTAEHVAFYEARARGGAGLIVTGGTLVHPTAAMRAPGALEAYRSENVPAFARLVDAIHRHGAPVFGQLYHRGREGGGASDHPVWAPSAVGSTGSGQVPHVMTEAEIDEIVTAFAVSAENLLKSGYDGIELHGAHGYLIAQFLSPLANRRTDEYGGDLDARMRFLIEIIDAIRARCGSEFPLGVRMTADDEIEGGQGLAEAAAIAARLSESGQIDYLSVTLGATGAYVKDMSHRVGLAAGLVAEVRKASGVPVIASQRITHPGLAEEILSAGSADLIGLGRALIADSDWAEKALVGTPQLIIPCVACLQNCRAAGDGGVSCIHNPVSGRESAWGPLQPASKAKRVVVVGGGPGGLEAARIAAERGHQVILFERTPHLGGQVRLAASAPHRGELDGVVSFRVEQLDRLGVETLLGTEATVDAILGEGPDVVVIATGAVPVSAPYEGTDGTTVVTVVDLLANSTDAVTPAIRTSVVHDDGNGFWETFSSVEALVERGVAVTVVTAAAQVAANIPRESIGPLLRRLRGRGVVLRPMTAVSAVEPGFISVFDPIETVAKGFLEEERLPADLVVYSGSKVADDRLFSELTGKVPVLHAIGDCVGPRRISNAVLEGHRVAREI